MIEIISNINLIYKCSFRREFVGSLRGSLREEDVISLKTAGDISIPREAACFHPSWSCPHPSQPQSSGSNMSPTQPHSSSKPSPTINSSYPQPLYDNIKLPITTSPRIQPQLIQAYDRYIPPGRYHAFPPSSISTRESGDYTSDVHSITSRLSNVSVETNRSDPTDLRFSNYLVSKIDFYFIILLY